MPTHPGKESKGSKDSKSDNNFKQTKMENDEAKSQGEDKTMNESLADSKDQKSFTDKDIEDAKEVLTETFLESLQDDAKADKALDTKAKEDAFVKDMKKIKKDEVKEKGKTPPPPPGGGQVKTKTGTVMSLVTKPESIVTSNTTVQLKVTGVTSGTTQVISVVLTP